MVVSTFSVSDKDHVGERYFEKSFILADVKSDVVLEIFFLIMNNTDVDFQVWDLQWRFYTTRNIFPTSRQVELIEKKEFAVAVLDPKHEVLVVYVAALNVDLGDKIYPSKKAQIVRLKADKASTKVSRKYANFADVFSPKSVVEFFKYMRINDHAIDDWQLPYDPIYSLGPVELETLKAYIENNLANSFIRLSKSSAETPIFFDKNRNGGLRLCVDYQDLNNLIIQNWYPLLLVGESLNWLGRAWRFTQLDLINAPWLGTGTICQVLPAPNRRYYLLRKQKII